MNRTSRLKDFYLTAALKFYGAADSFEGVDIFHFRPGTVLFGTRRTHGQIDVCAHGSLLHLAVGNVHINQHFAELFQIVDDFISVAEIRLGDDFNQRNAAPVVIDQRAGRIVHQLSRHPLPCEPHEVRIFFFPPSFVSISTYPLRQIGW